MSSLQDQLLKAGIVDKKKAKKIKQEQRKEARSRPKGQVQVDENREQAERALAEKAQRDRQLNKRQQEEAEKKAIQAQIIQLIKMNRVNRKQGDVAYQFSDGTKSLHPARKSARQIVADRNGTSACADRG